MQLYLEKGVPIYAYKKQLRVLYQTMQTQAYMHISTGKHTSVQIQRRTGVHVHMHMHTNMHMHVQTHVHINVHINGARYMHM